MAQTITTTLRATIAIDPQKLREGFGIAGSSNAPRVRITSDWGDGVASSQLSEMWHKTYALTTAAATATLDLLSGSLSGIVGEAGVNFSGVRGIYIRNRSTITSGHTLVVEGGTAGPWVDFVSGHLLLPRGTAMFMITNDATAWDLSTGSQTLRLRSAGGGTQASLSADILLLGLTRGL